jgi:lysophospholipase L1-like esterase
MATGVGAADRPARRIDPAWAARLRWLQNVLVKRSGLPLRTMVVTVVRGHTERVTMMFERGDASPPLSVGSRGDWRVSGPGVMPIHLWLSFDGERLFAASGDAAAQLRGRPLSNEYSPLDDGAELRFGFALLRVSHAAPGNAQGRRGRAGVRRQRLLQAVGAAALLVVAIAAASFFALRGGSPDKAAAPPSSASVVAQAPAPPAALPAATSPVVAAHEAPTPAEATPALAQPITEPPLVGSSLVAAPAAPKDAETFGQSPIFKVPAAYPQNIANRPIPRIGDKPWIISDEWRAQHERQLRALGRATAKVIFLGDSITEGWKVAPAYREHFGKYSPLNLGIANDTTQNVLWRLEHGALDGTEPRVVVVLIGINNLAGGFTAEKTADGVRAVVASVQAHAPTARVLLLAVFPARQEASHPLRQTIKDANRLLAGLANPGRVEFHDVGASLLEPDGSISKSTMHDFVHPTHDGFARVSAALAPVLDALMAPRN